MVNTADSTAGPMINKRIDPALDGRRLVLFFAGLIVFYVGVLLVTQPVLNGGEAELEKFVIGVMLAPTVGAILACVFGPGAIRFGMPSWWVLAGFLPAVLVFLITLVAAPASDAVTFHSDQVGALLLMAVVVPMITDGLEHWRSLYAAWLVLAGLVAAMRADWPGITAGAGLFAIACGSEAVYWAGASLTIIASLRTLDASMRVTVARLAYFAA